MIAVAAPAVNTSPLLESSCRCVDVPFGSFVVPISELFPLNLAAWAARSRYNCSLVVAKLFIVVVCWSEGSFSSVSVAVAVTTLLEDVCINFCCTYSSIAAACFWSHILCSSATIVPPVGNCVLDDNASTRVDTFELFRATFVPPPPVTSSLFKSPIELLVWFPCCNSSWASTPRLYCSWWINVRRSFVFAKIDCNSSFGFSELPDWSIPLLSLSSSSFRLLLVLWFWLLRSRFLNIVNIVM